MDLKKYISAQKRDKRRLHTILRQVKNHSTIPLTQKDVEYSMNEVSGLWENIGQLHTKIELEETDATKIPDHEVELDACEALMDEIQKELRKISQTFTPVAVPTPIPTANTSQVRLPKISLPSFSGNSIEWISFRDMFVTAIDSNTKISNAQKFTYLQSSLSGEASSIIRSYTITDANYIIAWDAVKKRYENKRELYMSIIKKFVSTNVVSADNPATLRAIVDSTNELGRALDALAVDDKWDAIQVFHVYQKLDPTSKQLWELTLQDTEIPKLKDLLDFVEQRARSLTASGSSTKPKLQQQPVSQDRNRKHHALHANPRKEKEAWKCVICEENHPYYRCPSFLSKSVTEKLDIVKKKQLCFNCLSPNHSSRECKSEHRCRKCHKKHNTLLHIEEAAGENPTTKVFGGHSKNEECQTVLATALVSVINWSGVSITYRALLDGGSTASFITESCVKKLGLSWRKSNAEVVGIAASNVGRTKGLTSISFVPHFETNLKSPFTVEAYILPKVTTRLPLTKLSNNRWTHLNNLRLADPSYEIPRDVDILLGADIFYDLLLSGRRTGPRGSPVAQNSKLGWIVGGSTTGEPNSQIQIHHADVQFEETLKKFWELEAIPKSNLYSPEEKECEQKFVQTCTRDNTGRYVVHIPLKIPQVQLGSSLQMAVNRLKQVERRLQSQPAVRELYVDFMKKYKELGHMTRIPVNSNTNRNYLPHHYVLKDMNHIHKFRVVFDGSAKTSSGKSYNEAQLVGPTVQDTLINILMRFRTHPVAFTADIKKMFRQILVTPAQQELQCIVWRNHANDEIEEYKLNTVTYGTASAPFLATRTMQQLAVDEEHGFPVAAPIISKDLYVDDCMSGAGNVNAAQIAIEQLRGITESAGLSLCKFASNVSDALERVPVELRETQDTLAMEEDEEVVKTLGLHWNTATDKFLFKVKTDDSGTALTKRSLLSQISKIFDPMGWLAPTIVMTKIMMQDVWREKTSWDEPPSPEITSRWENFKQTLKALEELRISRCIFPAAAESLELHGFSDASEKAYAAVVYVRAKKPNGEVSVSIVTSKSKVAPVKTISVPRLELCGALLLAELIESVEEALKTTFTSINAWTDSTIVLAWLKSNPSRWKTFVANRVSKIQDILPSSQWNHVQGVENPADCASRGIFPEELVHHPIWWTGPRWLLDENPVPVTSPVINLPTEAVEVEERPVLIVTRAHVVDSSLLSRFSSLLRLKRVTAWCFRFYTNVQEQVKLKSANQSKPKITTMQPLSAQELENALAAWIKCMQTSEFSTEIGLLSQNKHIPAQSKILSLAPFLDARGILRVGGRLRHAKIPEEKKTPILLPRHHKLTELVIANYHKQTLHGGTQLLQSVIGDTFWIIRARDAISHQVRKCVVCARFRATPLHQMMGDLPEARVNPCRPFSKTGVDYAGPFQLRSIPGRSKVTFKSWIALFICFVTRAIHLETVSSLSTDAFIAALRRFTGRRGKPSEMYSDCGTNFVGAAKDLKELENLIKSQAHNNEVSDHLSSQGIKWRFNPPGAPHFGGLWEAGVKSTKHHLFRVIGPVRLTFEEMSTVLAQIEGCLNSRPLTPMSVDPMDLTALTPAHFLIGGPMKTVPDPDLTHLPVNRLSRWQLVQQLQQHFWRRWSQEFLTRLQQRPKWQKQKSEIITGDMVLVKSEGHSPAQWPLARVTSIHPGQDGLTRVVTLRTAGGEMKRPITKLCLLPIDKASDVGNELI